MFRLGQRVFLRADLTFDEISTDRPGWTHNDIRYVLRLRGRAFKVESLCERNGREAIRYRVYEDAEDSHYYMHYFNENWLTARRGNDVVLEVGDG